MRFSKLSFILFCCLSLTLICTSSSFAAKRGKGLACLLASESVVEFCSNQETIKLDSKTSKKRSRKCAVAKQKERSACNLKRLRCNTYDTNVCGITNPCNGTLCRGVLSKLQTYDNICALKKAGSEFKARGACDAENTECNDKSRAVCGEAIGVCFRAPCVQWYDNICELKKAGKRQVADELCTGGLECNPNSAPVCGQPEFRCPQIPNAQNDQIISCAQVMPQPKWYPNQCSLQKDNASELQPSSCSGLACPIKGPICGLINTPCCKECACAQQIPSWFSNKCELLASGAVEQSPSACPIEECPITDEGEVCGVINPPCYYINETAGTNADKQICSLRPSSIGWYKNTCELLKAGAAKVSNDQCPQMVN